MPDDVASLIIESAREAARGAATALGTVQSKAGIWQAAMVPVLLPPAAMTFVKKDSVLALPLPWLLMTFVLAVVSVLTVVIAVYRLHLAATGRPRFTPTGTFKQLLPPELSQLRLAQQAEASFNRAMRWVAIAIVMAVATFLVTTFIPSAGARPNVRFTVANTAGEPSIVCGTIEINSEGQTFDLVPANGGDTRRYPLRQLLEVGSSC